MSTTRRPRIAVSRCLLGEAVRYDGGDERHALAVEVLGPFVEWVPACPEVGLGLGAPRPPVELVAGPRLVAVEGEGDWTGAMQVFARAWQRSAGRIDGYVLKARSPSCAVRDASRIGGPGLFTRLVVGDRPVIDEHGLEDPERRLAFAWRVEMGDDVGAARYALVRQAFSGRLGGPMTRAGHARALGAALHALDGHLDAPALRNLRVALADFEQGGRPLPPLRDAVATAAARAGIGALSGQRYLHPGAWVRAVEAH